MISSDANLALGSALELLLGPTAELIITGCHIKSLPPSHTLGHHSSVQLLSHVRLFATP